MLVQKILTIAPLQIDGLTAEQNLLVADALETVLHGWLGTPYRAGKQTKQRGVDCVHFLTAVYDELLGVENRYEPLPADASFHNKTTVGAGLRRFMEMYPSIVVDGDVVQPTDMIVCGPLGKNGGPGHGMIVGKDCLWHVGSYQVCKAGLAVMQGGTGSFKEIRRLADRSVLRRLL